MWVNASASASRRELRLLPVLPRMANLVSCENQAKRAASNRRGLRGSDDRKSQRADLSNGGAYAVAARDHCCVPALTTLAHCVLRPRKLAIS